jgi:hypothetical protein
VTFHVLKFRHARLEASEYRRKQAEAKNLAHLSFFENLERLDRVIRKTTDLEQMMEYQGRQPP